MKKSCVFGIECAVLWALVRLSLSGVSGGSIGGRGVKLLANYNSHILRVLIMPQAEDFNILWPL